MRALNSVAIILLIVGAINWGLEGLGMLINKDLNLVNAIFGGLPTLEAIIYLLVGIAGIYTLVANTKVYTDFSNDSTVTHR